MVAYEMLRLLLNRLSGQTPALPKFAHKKRLPSASDETWRHWSSVVVVGDVIEDVVDRSPDGRSHRIR